MNQFSVDAHIFINIDTSGLSLQININFENALITIWFMNLYAFCKQHTYSFMSTPHPKSFLAVHINVFCVTNLQGKLTVQV